MTESSLIIQPINRDYFEKFFPVVTAICCLISIVLFAGINMEVNHNSWGVYKKWGAPSATDIFNGSYWGLITANFLHIQIWHIAFNLYWLWIFGKKIEFESNRRFYILLILSSALVSSLSELSFSNETGIGLSGIGYSLFGFILIKSKTTETYKYYLDKKTIRLFIIWSMVCLVLTETKTWNIGNAAHIGGLFWGMTLAYLSKFDVHKQWLVGLSFLSLLATSIIWNPFSVSWLSYQAYELHKNKMVNDAKKLYEKILVKDPGNDFAKINLRQLEIQALQEKAFELHKSKKYKEARKVYDQILSIDPDEQWAKDNLKILPDEGADSANTQ